MSSDEGAFTAALRKARYNETVHITVQDDTSPEQERGDQGAATTATTVSLTPIVTSTGIQFNQVPSDQVVSRDLRTKRWFFPMLNDMRRNHSYEQAIRRCLSDQKSIVKILDVGSGTGLLAMIAASCSCCSNVTAVEMSSSMAAIAEQTIQDNGLSHKIQVLQVHSTELELEHGTKAPYQVCTSELLDDGLLGEGWIPAMRDAWERLLAPEAAVIPQGARLFGQLVETTLNPSRSSGSAKHRVLPIQAHRLFRENVLQPRSDPFPLFEFDVSRRASIPPSTGRKRSISVNVQHPSTNQSTVTSIGAVLVWWEVDLYPGVDCYSTNPHTAPFQDHWHPCLHWCEEPIILDDHDVIDVHVEHDDYRIQIDLTQPERKKKAKLAQPLTLACHESWTVERAWQLGDVERKEPMERALRRLFSKREIVKILDVSDFCWAGSIASTLVSENSPCNIISLESSSGNLPKQTAEWIRRQTKANNVEWEIRQCYTEHLSMENTPSVDCLVAEPYFEVLEGWHLQEALNLYAIVSVLRLNRVITSQTKILPQQCRVWGCLIESEDLRSAYRHCGDSDEKIQGFSHVFANSLAWPTFSTLSLPLWQYAYRELCSPFELGSLCYTNPALSVLSKKSNVSIPANCGRVDAMKVWVTYELGDNITITTNNARHNQLVHMLGQPISRGQDTVEIECRAKLGDAIEGNDDHLFEVTAV